MGNADRICLSGKVVKKGLISIVVPVYNVELYLEKCIASILKQTYSELEVIIVDDGSTDGSGAICDKYQKMDGRISVYHKKNGGASSARNLGLSHAKGEFIGFVDGDDFIAEDMYESMLEAMEEDVDIVTCGRIICYPVNRHMKDFQVFNAPRKVALNNEAAVEELLKSKIFSFAVWDKIYRRFLFNDIEFPEGRSCEDVPVTYALFAKSRKVINIGKAKYYNFHRENSSSRQEFFLRRIDWVLFAGEICKDVKNRYPFLITRAEALYIDYTYRTLNNIMSCKNKYKYKSIIKRLVKVLEHMSIRILKNPCIEFERKCCYAAEVYKFKAGKL